ncbi:hypothetical protein C5167_026348 [Papaver somniferum]|nr:hypothetical protein C5167_026348 [Papaver somniferum]
MASLLTPLKNAAEQCAQVFGLARSRKGTYGLHRQQKRNQKTSTSSFRSELESGLEAELPKMSVEEDHDDVMSEEDITVVDSMTIQEHASKKRKFTSKV